MYGYDRFDRTLLDQRTAQFRDQVERRIGGDLSEDEFRPLRLMNGLYLEMHAYMLRVAIPYGTLSTAQLRMLAHTARVYDRGYGHFTTRQNIQFNWVRLTDMPALLTDLASADMHGIQTSGSCVRNVTTDHLAGAAPDEVEDARAWCEIIRQWSTLHPEFSFLPRKFKIAVSGSPADRAATRVNDIGLLLHRNDAGEAGFEVLVGGGLGRTPLVAETIRRFLPRHHLLSYLEAILRVYNLYGRRDNKYKARIKILVQDLGAEAFAHMVEAEWTQIRDWEPPVLEREMERIGAFFPSPPFADLPAVDPAFEEKRAADPGFAAWAKANVAAHRAPGYGIATISLKPVGGIPGDADADQMDTVADLAERYSFGEIRVSREQNLVLPHVRLDDLFAVWRVLAGHGLATANAGLATDIVACPGMDYCSLANARSIPVAREIAERLDGSGRVDDIGELKIRISGCINACGQHSIGHIGICGVDKRGEEFYQITIGGEAEGGSVLGRIVGPAIFSDGVVDAVEALIAVYLDHRSDGERFIDTFGRIGLEPFKESLHAIDQERLHLGG